MLWLATSQGLSKFDGRSFTNFGFDHGLKNSGINCILEDSVGDLWIGTDEGLYKSIPDSNDLKFEMWEASESIKGESIFDILP